MADALSATEVANPSSSFDIIVARHAQYAGVSEDVPTNRRGWLTDEGVQQARELGGSVLEQARVTGGPVDILVINSPTFAENTTGELFGRRAEQTAVVATQTIRDLSRDLPPDAIRLLGQGTEEEDVGAIHHPKLTEPDIHYLEAADDPRAYIRAQVEAFGTEGRKEGYLRGDEGVDAIATAIGAETAKMVGKKTFDVLKVAEELAEVHDQVSPDRHLMVVLVTHDDNIRSLLQNQLNVGESAHDWLPGNAEALPLHVQNGTVTFDFKGDTYNAHL